MRKNAPVWVHFCIAKRVRLLHNESITEQGDFVMRKRTFFAGLMLLLGLLLCGCGGTVEDNGTAALTSPDALNETAENSHAEADTPAYFEADARSRVELSEATTGYARYAKAQYPRLKQKADGSYILFFQYATYGPHIYYTHSKDLKTWDQPLVLYNATQYKIPCDEMPEGEYITYFVNCDAVVLQNGDILTVTSYRAKQRYREYPAYAGIYLRRSTDGGYTWSAEQSIYKGVNWEPSIVELSNGEIQIFFSQVSPGIARWGLKEDRNSTGTAMLSSTDGGYTWTPEVTESPWQAKIAFQQYVMEVEGSPSFTDQMSVVAELYDGTLAAVCESKDENKDFHISVIYSDKAWSDSPAYDETGPSDRQSNLFDGAAPYIVKMPSGETALGYGQNSGYYLRVGDGSARKFSEPICVFDERGYWGAVEVTGANRLTAVYPEISDSNAILLENLYLNHALAAAQHPVNVNGKNTEDWADVTDAHFVGSASQAQATVRYAQDGKMLYILLERRDDSLCKGDRTLVYLADSAGKAYRFSVDETGAVTLECGTGVEFSPVEKPFSAASTAVGGGMVTEIGVNLAKLGLAGRTGLKTLLALFNAEADGTLVRDLPDGVDLYDANTWLDVGLANGKAAPLAAGDAVSAADVLPNGDGTVLFSFADSSLAARVLTQPNGMEVKAQDGYVSLRITDNTDPFVSLDCGELDADTHTYMLICCRNDGDGRGLGLYYCTGGAAPYAYTAECRTAASMRVGDGWQIVGVDFAGKTDFSGKLTTLRIDPYDGAEAPLGDGIDIAWIAFLPDRAAAAEYLQ